MIKNFDLSSINFEKAIVHDLPKHRKSETEVVPLLSKNEVNFTPKVRLFFKEKVIQALKSDKAIKISFKKEPVSLVQKNTLEIFLDKNKFVEHSREIANHLFKSQNGLNSSGLLVLILINVESQLALIVFKLDKDEGAQLKDDDGTLSIIEIENLVLSNKTKIQKIVLLADINDASLPYHGIMLDNQIEYQSKNQLTSFFLNEFIGAIAFDDPAVATKKLFETNKEFIEKIPDPIKKAKYLGHLVSYLQKNEKIISVEAFANEYLDTPEERDILTNMFKERGVSTDPTIKDTSLIKGKLDRIVIDFENDISVTLRQQSISHLFGHTNFDKEIEGVSLVGLENGFSKLQIISKISNITY